MTRMFTSLALSVLVFSAGGVCAQDLPGEPVSQKKIEKAFRECIKEVDSEMSSVTGNTLHREEHRKSELDACHKERRNCVERPKSVDCRGFVEDYAPGKGE